MTLLGLVICALLWNVFSGMQKNFENEVGMSL